MAHLLDLFHLGRPKVIASYLLPGAEPALVDCGPSTCVDALERGLAANGLALTDVRHLVLTHIHLDHAGAAGVLTRRHPGLRVHVSEIGAPHLVDPTRLERSARRIYGEDFDFLWGELAPVPEENVDVIGERVLDLEAWPTPGHASHHVSFLAPDGSCYAGDATGVVIAPARFLAPVSPPPDIDVEAWEASIDAIEKRRPERLRLPHFGLVEDVTAHLAELRVRLRTWSERVRDGADEGEFVAAAEAELAAGADAETAASYVQAAPFWQSYAGLRRYWEKKGVLASPERGSPPTADSRTV
jgi:glyoxylase-like metal-dependent hydrolase (beta-lactamase superfamily II)